MTKPYLIEFPRLGGPDIGYLSVAEQAQLLPFRIERVFWTYYTPETIVRGRHAHYRTEQVLVAAAGRILVTTEMPSGELQVYVLDSPHLGLYIPPHVWHTMQYSEAAVQLAFVATPYEEADYIREYTEFKKVWASKQP
ncbi:sugar 3,4-ketoisomerase [Hymenobacter weizhouensis]|uniref:sugar 3,4-ketoisomerase n=1 Tax=Hymenobacter sp. YIM 151500-1 TaxID=2987689 RepID=UPI002226AC9F|nr:FdtA/QdtA family cupin domain-containing protein [Hymenobacter sp. YIM 151500-1]UYZ61377.1 FdtA/QdtA family cupin domain-containing protein [Hymenobacter sp. YIM 151500-1]